MFRKLLVIGFMLLAALPVRGQIVLTISAPDIDSFPIVKVGVNVTQNGGPATQIGGSTFTVHEDGTPGNVLGLAGCGGNSSAGIAIVLDTSQSMDASLGSGPPGNRTYAMFDTAIEQFIASFPGPSQLVLVPFADNSTYWYPDTITQLYTMPNNPRDSALFKHRLDSVKYIGTSTNVISGIEEAARALTLSSLPRRDMILVTDDAVADTAGLAQLLGSLGIRLYVLEVARDSVHTFYNNYNLALATGGGYYAAYDTTLYLPMLLAIGQLIFAEHCTLEYRSLLPCPAWSRHEVAVTLNYQGSVEQADTSYVLGRDPQDTLPPRLALDTPGVFSRRLHAYNSFPCESGLESLTDSASSNFTILPTGFMVDSASDSLVVIDTLYPADAYFIATDTAGTVSRIHIHYQPQPDIHPPQFGVPIRVGTNYTEDVQEMLPWDRGLDTIYLAAGAKNLSLDSIRYAGKQLAHIFFHILNASDTAKGCLTAIDSAGNADSLCIEWDGETADTLPPLFKQDAIAEPRLALSGVITEERPHDRGVRQVILTPISNTAAPQIFYDSAQEARVAVALVDSMYPAVARVEAYDSAGNGLLDSLVYEPLPDTLVPIITYTTPTNTTFLFYATDTEAWDRGLASLSLLPSTVNASSGAAVFTDAHRASLAVTVTDRTLNATIAVQAIDSVGNQTTVTVPFAAIPLISLGDSVIDFGPVAAGTTVTRSIVLTNPNDIPLTLPMQALLGDASDFTILSSTTPVFPALGSQTLTFEFHPTLLGTYQASTTLEFHQPDASVTLVGRGVGAVQLALDTVTVTASQSGVLHLSVDVEPKPSNLDTIGFTLTYNPDMLTLGDFPSCPSGSLDTGLCLYHAYWSGGTEGNKQALLVSNSPGALTTLSFGHAVLAIPFQTYVSTHDTTTVHIQPLNTYSANVDSTQDGLVRAGDTCGTAAMRTEMTGGLLAFRIVSIVPNPAQSSLVMTVNSAAESDAEIRIVSVSGLAEQIVPCHLSRGEQSVLLPELPKASGTYEVVVRMNGTDVDRRPIEVVR